MYLSILVVFLTLRASLPAEGCSCAARHLQRSFCEPGNVVLKVKFLSANYTEASSEYGDNYSYTLITYTVDLLQVFEGGSFIQNLNYIYTSTEYNCEFYFPPSNFNKEYLVIDSYNGGLMNLMLCDYVVPWSALSASQIKGIQGAYAKACDCNVLICYYQPCSEATTNDCIYEGKYIYPGYPVENTGPAPEGDNLPEDHKMCARDKDGTCVWQSIDQC